MTDTTAHQAELTGEALFYIAPEPLSKEAHAKLGIKNLDAPYAFTARTHLVPITVTEFGPASLCYPIIFIGPEFTPVAVMGVNADENLYVDEKGAYASDAYLPAYIRRYPFVLANDAAGQRMVVCIDAKAPMVSESPDAPFFENGEPTAFTRGAIEFCNNFEQEAQRTLSFVNLLKELDLFEEKTATYTPPTPEGGAGEPQTIATYQGVSEAKLGALPPEKIKELMGNGAMSQIYAHLISLFGWDRLIVKAMLRPRTPVAANN